MKSKFLEYLFPHSALKYFSFSQNYLPKKVGKEDMVLSSINDGERLTF